MRLALLPVVLTLVLAASPARADFADTDAMDKYCLMLKKRDLNPFPICNEKTGKGSVFLNNREVYWTDATKVYIPGSRYVIVSETSQGEIVSIEIVKAGWKVGGRFAVKTGDVFVNVGPSKIEFDGEWLRKGEYVHFDGTNLVRGSLRDPDPIRIEPRDTNREKAADLFSEAVFAESTGDYSNARAKFREVALTYPETTSGERALAALHRIGESGPVKGPARIAKELPLDPDSVPDSVFEKQDGQTADEAAEYLLSLGKLCKSLNHRKQAFIVLRGLIDRYPATKAAAKAVTTLGTLGDSQSVATK